MPLKFLTTGGDKAQQRDGFYAASFQTSTRGLVYFLVEKGQLKPGFRQILHGRQIREVEEYLLAHNLFSKEQLTKLIAEYFGLPYLRLIDHPINPTIVRLLPRDVVERYRVLPFELKNATLSLAVTEPAMLQHNAPSSLVKLRREKGLHIRLVIVPEGDAKAILDKVYAQAPNAET